jgi:glycerol-1-phosphate dehydrogenase [NAD(P)+]
MKYYADVVVKDNAQDFLNGLDQRALVIYSPTSLAQMSLKNNKVHMIDSRVFGRNVALMNALSEGRVKYENLVSLGGGTATDVAKFIATKMGAKFICIPSMLSTNAYSTDKVALVVGEDKITLDAKLADSIILDTRLISAATRENLYGLADVLSIHTALFDWKIANEDIGESIDDEIYSMADNLLRQAQDFILKHDVSHIQNDTEEIFKKVGDAGYITNLYGTGRPESGSEHIFAKRLEKKVELPHGVSVSAGITLMSILQDNQSDGIFECVRKIGTLGELTNYGVTRSILRDTLGSLKPREDRYSIINRIDFTDKVTDKLLTDFENITGVKLKD